MKSFGMFVLTACLFGISASMAVAADSGTKAEAVALVQKAGAYIQQHGNEKAFAEISNSKGQFVDRDLYVVVYDSKCKCLAHGINRKMIGRDLLDLKDVDGKPYMKERAELMAKSPTAWQQYKFRNPVTNQIEPKTMYLQRFGDLIVGCGVYNK